jgi:hypothetical protein
MVARQAEARPMTILIIYLLWTQQYNNSFSKTYCPFVFTVNMATVAAV